MGYPPFPDPDELIADTNSLAEATGLEELMPGMGAMMAAMAYIMHDAVLGESKDCPCNVCVRIREMGETLMVQVLWS
jgi:hypothetical protein